MEPDRISLSYVVHCLLESKNLESDSAEPGMDNEFPRKTEFFVPLIQTLQTGEIEARGTFSRVRLDHPQFDENTTNAQLLLLSADFRVRRDIVIGVGKEAEPSNIPSAAWWYEGAIWEKSALWVNDRVTIDESRWRDLKIERTTPGAQRSGQCW
ncbi:MAG: hypothetical protein COB16_06260 [Rhodobacteraceae bacterium]|nr:MAG: hypothetical protein COB16_06260 [Paracoccaceae bacterium]